MDRNNASDNASDNASAVLITGISGYVGVLIGSALLKATNDVIIGVIRDPSQKEVVFNNLLLEYQALDTADEKGDKDILKRVQLLTLSEVAAKVNGSTGSKTPAVKEVIHCAGSVDYFDEDQLNRANIQYTKEILDLAQSLPVNRFIFISTAYSCGYIDGGAPESLHPEPGADPTVYTRTKRQAEWLVAQSGIPYLILRPSILIGDSKTGRYSGKRYGLYQQWMGLERLLCSRYHKDFHTVAPKQPLNLLHQDSFQSAFLGFYTNSVENTIAHIVSRHDTTPTMRELWDLWLRDVSRPETVYYYDNVGEVPLKNIDIRQRSYLTFASINLQIGAHHWQFSDNALSELRQQGVKFTDATLDTVMMCQDRFVNASAPVQKYLETYQSQLTSGQPKVIEVPCAGPSTDGQHGNPEIKQKGESEASLPNSGLSDTGLSDTGLSDTGLPNTG
jgi:nucleoside-diphosphate-sugar epimerase